MNVNVKDDLIYLKGVVDGTAGAVIPGSALVNNPVAIPLVNSGGVKVGATALFTERNGVTYLGNNAIHNGTSWFVLDSTTHAVWLEEMGDNGSSDKWAIYRSPSPTNPASFVTMLALDNTAKLTGAGFYDSGEITLVAGASNNLSHGLAGKPRFLGGYFAASAGLVASASASAPFLGNQALPVPYIASVSSTTIAVTNGAGATRYIRVIAMY